MSLPYRGRIEAIPNVLFSRKSGRIMAIRYGCIVALSWPYRNRVVAVNAVSWPYRGHTQCALLPYFHLFNLVNWLIHIMCIILAIILAIKYIKKCCSNKFFQAKFIA